MTVVAIGSVHGSPGATSLALDLARTASMLAPHETLFVEADPDGGCVAARLDLAVRPGLTELAGAARVGIASDDLWKFAQPSHGIAVICAHPAAEQVHAALRAASNHIAKALTDLDHAVFVDVGRLRPGSPSLALATSADHLVIVNDNTVEAIVSLSHRSALISGLGPALVVMTDSKPYGSADIQAATGLEVWGSVPRSTRRRRDAANRAAALADLWARFGRLDEADETAELVEDPSRTVADLLAEPAMVRG